MSPTSCAVCATDDRGVVLMPAIRTTPAVRVLLITSISLFLVQLFADTFLGTHVFDVLGLVPALFFRGYFWQCVTYMFMHSDLFHILFNMLILWMVGTELEAQWGTKEFLKYYFVCGISAGFFYLAVLSFFHGSPATLVPMVGSSGAIYGLLVAYGILYSERQMLFMMIFPMKAKHFVLLLAAIEFISTVFYSHSGIANAAHLGGMIIGFTYLVMKTYLKIRSKQRSSGQSKKPLRRMKASHIRLVVNNETFREFDSDDDDDGQSGQPTTH